MPTRKVLSSIAGLATIALAASMVPGATATAAPAAKPGAVDLLSASDGATSSPVLTGERSRSVAIDESGLDAARSGDELTIGLFDGESVTAVIDAQRTIDGVTSWTGTLQGEGGSFVAVDVDGFRHITISSTEQGTYEVTSTKGGDYVLTEAQEFTGEGKDVVVPGDEPAAAGAPASRRTSAPAADAADRTASDAAPTAEDAASTIDVAIVYPASLVAELGAGPMQAQFAQGIAQTNQALTASGVPTQVRLVGSRQLAQPQLSSTRLSLFAMQNPADGQYDEIAGFREEVHADLVSMWLSGEDPARANCGIGYLGQGDPKSDPNYAFTALYYDGCATANLTFAHELGHNLSAGHDYGASEQSTGKAYAHGYVDAAANSLTIMAYPTTCASCVRTVNYSNPSLIVNGRPQGTVDPPTNNVQAINEQIGLAANYRQSQIYPGAVAVGGFPRFKGKAKAATTEWVPAVTLSYQWYLDGAPIAGATSDTYKLRRSAIGHSLNLLVTGSAPYYPPTQVATAPVIVGKALFKTKRPKVRGKARPGRVLKVAKLKGWSPKPSKKSVKVRYQWFKNGKKIKGAKKAAYRVRAKDRGKKIYVKVTVKKKSYQKASRTSKKIKIRR